MISPQLLAELERVLARTKFRRYASVEQTRAFIDAVAGLTADPNDDYLVSLARAAQVNALVSGDRHLLSFQDAQPPVLTPRAFLEQLGEAQAPPAG